MKTKQVPYLGQMLYYYPQPSDRTCRINNTSINAAIVIGFPDLREEPGIVALKIFTNGEPIVRKDNVRQQTGHETGTWSFPKNVAKADLTEEKEEPVAETPDPVEPAPANEAPVVAESTVEPVVAAEPITEVPVETTPEPEPVAETVPEPEVAPAPIVDTPVESKPTENLAEEVDNYIAKAGEAIESTDDPAAPALVGESADKVDQGIAEPSAEVVEAQPPAVAEEEKVSDLQVKNPFLHNEVDKTEEQVSPAPAPEPDRQV